MRLFLFVFLLFLCSCDTLNALKLKDDLPTVAEQAKEQAREEATGNPTKTAPCKAYIETVPGVPVWPGVRMGGLYTETDIILPPVDLEETIRKRLAMHRIEQREYWSNKLNKGIILGVIIMVIGVVVKLWAKLDVGARISFYGAAFAAFCVACIWYFDYIPLICLAFIAYIAFDMMWSVYSDKKAKTVKKELVGTVETLKDKVKDSGLVHLWNSVKDEVKHSPETKKVVGALKPEAKKVVGALKSKIR